MSEEPESHITDKDVLPTDDASVDPGDRTGEDVKEDGSGETDMVPNSEAVDGEEGDGDENEEDGNEEAPSNGEETSAASVEMETPTLIEEDPANNVTHTNDEASAQAETGDSAINASPDEKDDVASSLVSEPPQSNIDQEQTEKENLAVIPQPPGKDGPSNTNQNVATKISSSSTTGDDSSSIRKPPRDPDGNVSTRADDAELPSLEECLYGPSLKPQQSSPLDKLRQSWDSEKNNGNTSDSQFFVVDDDWSHIREPGLWKRTPPHHVRLANLRKLALAGIEDQGSHRAVAWRVLLGYLPPENREWEQVLTTKRKEYQAVVLDWFAHPHDTLHGDELRWKQRRMPSRRRTSVSSAPPDGGFGDDDEDDLEGSSGFLNAGPAVTEPEYTFIPPPAFNDATRKRLKRAGLDSGVLDIVMKKLNALNISRMDVVEGDDDESADDSKETSEPITETTRQFVESVKLVDEIRKDVDRTFPDLAFYLDPDRDLGKRRYHALERILFVWSKSNKGVRYVQGMNEIVGTIYYVLANDWNEEWAREAEADTYWLFSLLLEDMHHVFMPHMDNSETGIHSRINMMQNLLRRHDPEVTEHFNDIGVECSFFAIRWWTTLLSREFLLPDTIRLWDSMFASTHKDNFLCYVCVTMVIVIRETLLKGDFSTCLRTLQGYPTIRMDRMLDSSRSLWLYERQITVACHKGGIGLQQALEAIRPPRAVLMAFGLRHGILPGSKWDQAAASSSAMEKARSSVREAGNAVRGWFGRASKMASQLGGQLHQRVKSNDIPPLPPDDDEDDVYMQAIQDAETGKLW